MTTAPLAALRSLADHLRDGAPLADETRDFLAEALDTFLGAHGTVPLDRTLGIGVAPGQRSIRTMEILARRDDLLRCLVRDYFSRPSRNAAAAAVHKAWSRYASSAWTRERLDDAVPITRLRRPELVFWQMMKLQDRVLSERTIRSILAAS